MFESDTLDERVSQALFGMKWYRYPTHAGMRRVLLKPERLKRDGWESFFATTGGGENADGTEPVSENSWPRPYSSFELDAVLTEIQRRKWTAEIVVKPGLIACAIKTKHWTRSASDESLGRAVCYAAVMAAMAADEHKKSKGEVAT